METNQAAMAQLFAMLMGAGQQQPTQGTIITQPTAKLPYGCLSIVEEGVYSALSANGLNSWDNTVLCEDGGTHEGLKVLFLSVKKRTHSEKQFSARDGFMARFEISKAGGKNPMNEVINLFVKNEFDYKPYLDPRKWSAKIEVIEFKSEDETEPVRKFKLNMIYFMGSLISDPIERKARHIAKRLGGMYECYDVDGEVLDLDEN